MSFLLKDKKIEEGFEFPTLLAFALNTNVLDEGYKFLVCTTVFKYIRYSQHLFLSLLDKWKMQLFTFPFTVINMNSIL